LAGFVEARWICTSSRWNSDPWPWGGWCCWCCWTRMYEISRWWQSYDIALRYDR